MKTEINFSENFTDLQKELIQTINEAWFARVFKLSDNYSVIANILIATQKLIDEKRESVENNTEFVVTEPDVYQIFKENFDRLFEIVDIDNQGKEMLVLLSDLLTHRIIEAIGKGIENGDINLQDEV